MKFLARGFRIMNTWCRSVEDGPDSWSFPEKIMDVGDKNGQICNLKHFEVVFNIRGQSQILLKSFVKSFPSSSFI